MKKRTNKFYAFTDRWLDERVGMEEKGETLLELYYRDVWYLIDPAYTDETGDMSLDFNGTPNDREAMYRQWRVKGLLKWSEANAKRLGIDVETYWRALENLNLWASARAKCETWTGKKFDVDKDTRSTVTAGCSLIIVCEKEGPRERLVRKLSKMGYKVNIITTGGHSTNHLKELIIAERIRLAKLGNPTFYILSLHDYDLAGVQILITLKGLYDGVIDVGVSPELIEFLTTNYSDVPEHRLWGKYLSKRTMHEVARYMKSSPDYTEEGYKRLQGRPTQYIDKKGKKKEAFTGERIEIGVIEAEYGSIDPLAEFVAMKIQKHCKVWDLRRIGVEVESLKELRNRYERHSWELGREAIGVLAAKHKEQQKSMQTTLDWLIEEVKKDNPIEPSLVEILEKNWSKNSAFSKWATILETPCYHTTGNIRPKALEKLNEEYKQQMERKWVPDYQDRMNAIRKQIRCYKGDVREGQFDLPIQGKKLQSKMKEDMDNDPELEPFKEKWSKMEWGKELVEQEPVRIDERKILNSIISIAQERLAELEDDSNG